MAQLVTTKEKYGVSVAARIDPQLAYKISARAEKLGVSMAKMLSLIIVRGFNPEAPIVNNNQEEIDRLQAEAQNLHDQIVQQREVYINTAAEFIARVSDSDDDKLVKADLYNEVFKELKLDNDVQ